MTPTEWFARRERNRKIRAELAVRRAAGKQRRHIERLAHVDQSRDLRRSAVVHGAATEPPGEG